MGPDRTLPGTCPNVACTPSYSIIPEMVGNIAWSCLHGLALRHCKEHG